MTYSKRLLLLSAMLAVPTVLNASPVETRSSPTAHVSADWWSENGAAARALIGKIEEAEADALSADRYRPDQLRQLMESALAGRAPVEAAREFDRTLQLYAADVARAQDRSTLYVDPAAAPRPVSPTRLLAVAAAAPRFAEFIRTMGWMHPYYAALREEVLKEGALHPGSERLSRLKLNLERARVLPRGPGPAIVVNTAAARLEYFRDREVQDSMRVVVGQSAQQTPMMAGLVRYAILNPYWHVPPDLTRKNIAPRVLKEGMRYFQSRGYQVVTSWAGDAEVIPADTVDWEAVAAGRTEVLVRQLPGPHNGMGEVKFMFPNDLGIYLHDTPSKGLFAKSDRQFSAGCVRLEDADRLRTLLLGAITPKTSQAPEQVIALAKPVPVYLTYMTIFPSNGRIVERKDVYGRDKLKREPEDT